MAHTGNDKPYDVIEPGHVYLAYHLELSEEPGHVEKTKIVFAKKEPVQPGDSELEVTLEGTTNEAVVGILIDRMLYLQSQLECPENKRVLQGLYMARDYLAARTKDRRNRGVEGTIKE
jgi:hypothetical protein